MRFVAFVLFMVLSVAYAQFGDFYSGGVFGPAGGRGGYNPLASVVRDPRQNTGPVVFPPSPAGNPAETSGVVVGASGYGFVPPSAQGFYRFYHNQFYY